MKKALILNNAYSQLKSSLNQSVRLKEEFEKIGIEIDVRRNNFFPAYVSDGGDIISNASDYGFCVYLDKDKYISAMLEKSGLRLFNRHKAICDCDDKMTTFIELANNNIKMPETVAGFLCYDRDAEINKETADFIEEKFGYPLIVKTCFGSLGKGVYKIDDRAQLISVMNKLKCEPHLFQKFISASSGTDLRVIVIGGECVAAMKRTSFNDFRSNIELGGKGEVVTLSCEVTEICKKVAKILKLDYCGIDLLFDGDEFLVCEVNSNAFFGGIEKVTGVNIAQAYARYIAECCM